MNIWPYTNFHELNLDWVLQTVKALDAKVNGIKEDILVNAKDYTDGQIHDLKVYIDAADKALDEALKQLAAVVDANRIHCEEAVSAAVEALEKAIDATSAADRAYTDAQINALRSDVSQQVYVYSPITGEYVDIQTAVNQLAGVKKNALTATEYDALAMTATRFDGIAATAYDYDYNGKRVYG